MKVCISAGHSKAGTGCGASSILVESTENRKVKNEVVRLLKLSGVTVYDCTIDTCTSSNQLVKDVVTKHNSHTRDLDVQIHFNSGANNTDADGRTTGVEVLTYSLSSESVTIAERVVKKISGLGFKNRGVKARPDLYFTRATQKPAILIECCFVDDEDDAKLYNYSKMAKAIAEGIINNTITETTTISTTTLNTCSVNLYVLKKNVIDEQVKTLQQLLNFKITANLTVDGNFGDLTETAVKSFQVKNNLTVDGVVGANTWNKLLN